VPVEAPVAETVATAHDDFDWSVDKRNVTPAILLLKKQSMILFTNNTFKQINDGEMIQATVEIINPKLMLL